MTDLSGLELRKALCLAIGWTRGNRFWHHPTCEAIQDCVTECGIQDEQLPKYDSDATLSEALLDKVCRERGWYWQVTYLTYAHAPEQNRYACVIGGADGLHFDPLREDGSTPSEARARCLLSALKADTRKEKS